MPFYHADEASARQETCKQDAKTMLSGCEMLYIGAQNMAFCMTKNSCFKCKKQWFMAFMEYLRDTEKELLNHNQT